MNRRVSVFLVLLIFFVSIYAAITFYVVHPKPTQPFIGFGVFSQQRLAGYLPASNQTVSVNETINWQLEITNRMGSVQFVEIVSRIGNLTTITPSGTSPASVLPPSSNSTVFVPDGSVVVVNFTWKIVVIASSGPLEFLKMDINGREVTSNVGAASGRDFRLFFELWTFDDASGSFQYGWKDMGLRIGSWLQVWFSVGP